MYLFYDSFCMIVLSRNLGLQCAGTPGRDEGKSEYICTPQNRVMDTNMKQLHEVVQVAEYTFISKIE